MKTTYVINQSEINKFQLPLKPYELEVVDYFLNRQKLVRWYKKSSDTNNGKFFELDGLIDK